MQNMYWFTPEAIYYMCGGHLTKLAPYWHPPAWVRKSWERWFAEATERAIPDHQIQQVIVSEWAKQ